MPPAKRQISLAPRAPIGTDARTEWRPLSESAIPVSPQAAGPAAPERGIGPATGSGVFWHVRHQGPGNGSLPGIARAFGVQDTVERHGGFDVVMEKIVQREQEDPASNGRERIDDFRLAGSRTWRRRGGPFTKRGWPTQVAHAFNRHNASLSEGGALAVVVGALPGKPYWKGVGTDSPRRLRPPSRGGARRVPPRPARRTGRGGSGGSDPMLFGAGAPPGRGKWPTLKPTIYPPRFSGSLPPQ